MGQLPLEDRITGCLGGSAVGDTRGAPTECMDCRSIRRVLGDWRTFADLDRAFADLEGRKVAGNVARVKAPRFISSAR